MLVNYMQNSAVSMTKETYFEMCDMLGEEPIEENIPLEIEDFPFQVQQAMLVYRMLRDEWDGFSGTYFGKSLLGIKDLLEAVEIEEDEHKLIITLIRQIDNIRSNEINNKRNQAKPAS